MITTSGTRCSRQRRKVMIPFCRTLEGAREIQLEMSGNGLVRSTDDLEVYVTCEIPDNVVRAAEFAELFDGFSIGSDDLTQLALGVDRDSELLAHLFDEVAHEPGAERSPDALAAVANAVRTPA